MDERGNSSENPIGHFNGGSFHMFQADFMQETEFENSNFVFGCNTVDPIEKFCTLDYECNDFTNYCPDVQLPPLPYVHNEAVVIGDGGCGGVGDYDAIDLHSNPIWNQEREQTKVLDQVFGDDSSSETPAGRSDGGTKGDRMRTLISERKRRSGMKEKLFALRLLVPNITKMDKASIVGDAARYIQELQTQARNLKTEIATLENQETPFQISKKLHVLNSFPVLKKILKMDVFQVEEKGYYVRLVCNKGRGVAVSLHKALESITTFQVAVYEFDINLPNLKLWLAGAFLNQGFEFTTFPLA